MRKILAVIGLVLAFASTAVACPCIRFRERVAVDRYAVRLGHFYVASCAWGAHNRLTCRLVNYDVSYNTFPGNALAVTVCRSSVTAFAGRNQIVVLPDAAVVCVQT